MLRLKTLDPPLAACEACGKAPSEWFIYLVTELGSSATFHSQRCEACTKDLIMSVVKESNNPVLINHKTPRLEIWR